MATRLRTAATENESGKQFCTFRLAGHLFGVDILEVKEINREVEFTPIPHASHQVRGYINIRGQIHLVMDLRLILGFPQQEVDAESRVVIFKDAVGDSFGVLVDRIGDIVAVRQEQIEARSQRSGDAAKNLLHHQHLIQGDCKLEDELLIILKAQGLLQSLEGGATAGL